MQHVDRRGGRLEEARRAAVGRNRDGRVRAVLDVVAHGEHVVFVDRDRAGEGDALVVGERQLDRARLRQLAGAVLRPDGLRAGHLAGRLAADIADLGEVAMLGLGRAEQRDDRARLVDGLVEFLELQVVEAGARQVDGAGEGGRVDLDAGGLGKGLVTRFGRGRAGRSARQRAVRPGRGRRGATRGGGRRLLRLRGLLRFQRDTVLLELGVHVEELPRDEDQHGQRDRHEIIAVVFHHSFPGAAGRCCCFCFLPVAILSLRPAASVSKDAPSTSRLATTT